MQKFGMDFSCHMKLQAYCESLRSKSTSKGRGGLGFLLPVICTPEEFLNDENY
jgi:hypothetical protein